MTAALGTKKDVGDFEQLAAFADTRAARSLRRNDPWAWAYWSETRSWALGMHGSAWWACCPRQMWLETIERLLKEANGEFVRSNWSNAARLYSRAKWCVIIARNRGFRMSPRETGVTPSMFKREVPCP